MASTLWYPIENMQNMQNNNVATGPVQLAKCIKSLLLASGNRPPHLPNRVAVAVLAPNGNGNGNNSLEVFLHRKSPDRITLQVARQTSKKCGFVEEPTQNTPNSHNTRLMGELELGISAFFKPEALIKKIRASLIDDEAKAFFDSALETV